MSSIKSKFLKNKIGPNLKSKFEKKMNEDKEEFYSSLNDTNLVEDIEALIQEDLNASNLLNAVVDYFDQGGIISNESIIDRLFFQSNDLAREVALMEEISEKLKVKAGIDLELTFDSAQQGFDVFYDYPVEFQTAYKEINNQTGSGFDSGNEYIVWLEDLKLSDTQWRNAVKNGKFSKFVNYIKGYGSKPSSLTKRDGASVVLKDYLIGELA